MRNVGIGENLYDPPYLKAAVRARTYTEQKTDGPLTAANGISGKTPGSPFERIGRLGEFAEAARDPKAQEFFGDYVARLQGFNSLSSPQPGPVA